MWNVKAKVMPVIIWSTGTISKSFRQYLSNISGKDKIEELQKTAIFGNAQILREGLMERYRQYLTWEITLHVAQTVTTEQLQHYIL
jgi:hypothetical protein